MQFILNVYDVYSDGKEGYFLEKGTILTNYRKASPKFGMFSVMVGGKMVDVFIPYLCVIDNNDIIK